MKATFRTQTLIFLLFCCITRPSAQTINTWKGGAPGHETDWAYFKNWSRNTVPQEFDRVIIPDVSSNTRSYPVIHNGEVEVLSVTVLSGARLTIEANARLLTAEWLCLGECPGCDGRIWAQDEAQEPANTAGN